MSKYAEIFCLFVLPLAFLSCGEDRTHEYEELTERDHWMVDVMRSQYLWGDSIKEENIVWKSYFSDSKTFFKTLLAFAPVSDTWSWCAIDTVNEDFHERGYFNHLDSYGIDFVLMTDPTGATSRQYARVKTVIDGSPASRCGLQRGDFIGSVDDNRMTSSYTSYLINGKARTIVVNRLGLNEDESEYVWTFTDTLKMEKSEYVEDVAFPVYESLMAGTTPVAYLMCNRLKVGPTEIDATSSSYLTQLENVMTKLKADAPKVVVLDLRLCNDGEMQMANKLASYMLPHSQSGSTFAKTFYNTSRSDENKTVNFDETALSNSLQPEDVFVITSSYTKGAAEWVIRSLQYALGNGHVYLVGMTSAGQNVLTEEITSAYSTTLHPAVAFVGDANGDYDYAGGISPDFEINEMSYLQLYPYGNVNETIFSFILSEVEVLY